ncbi:MAG: iron-containing alcohol dehydrogenase [Lachnospiraceae bacterium]|nr:iron-containing alcohol dehydrogenase [Lachnospiraceae bacterium]
MIQDGTDEEVAETGICAMENFYRSIEMPTNLNELGIHPTDAQIEDMAKRCMIAAGTRTGSAKIMTQEDAIRIYQNSRG